MKNFLYFIIMIWAALQFAEAMKFQSAGDVQTGWYSLSSSSLTREESICLNYSIERLWEPVVEGGRLIFRKSDRKYWESNDIELPEGVKSETREAAALLALDGGWLVGFDHGEWGGGLVWFAFDGRYDVLVEKNTRTILQADKGVLVAGGLAHMGIDEGYVSKLIREDEGEWSTEFYKEIDSDVSFVLKAPQKGHLLVTNKALVHLSEKGDLSELLKTDAVSSIYPIGFPVVFNGKFYIGGRGGVVSFYQENGQWNNHLLVPKKNICEGIDLNK